MDFKRISSDGWTLDDGEQVHRESPTTFYLPPMETRESLQPGQFVKLIFRISLVDDDQSESVQVERMWVVVEKVSQMARTLASLTMIPIALRTFRLE
jgi:hypothetical protein